MGRGDGLRSLAGLGLLGMIATGTGAGILAASTGPGSGAPGTAIARPQSLQIPAPTVANAAPTKSTATVVAAASPAVVKIEVTEASPARSGQVTASGTGMLVTSSGVVLTNNHVVEGALSIRVVIVGHAGSYGASVLGVDPSADVALLRVEKAPSRLPIVTLGNAKTAAVGNAVVALGYAYGRGSRPAVAAGTVTGLNRTETATGGGVTGSSSETLHGLIQVGARIVSGDSGGPLLNARGQVIGMNTMGVPATNGAPSTGFAVPVNTAVGIANRVLAKQAGRGVILGESPFLGIFEVQAGGLGAPSAATQGVYVVDVAINGPAQKAGIVAGDTIVAINGTATPTSAKLQQLIAAHRPGEQIRVQYLDPLGASHIALLTLGAIAK